MALNIIAKVDNTKPIMSNGVLNVHLNEAVSITDEDYLKFKKEIDGKNPTLASRQKDFEFQKAFKELWPSTYSRINEKESSSVVALEELNRQKMFYNSLLAHDINAFKTSVTAPTVKKLICTKCSDTCYINTVPVPVPVPTPSPVSCCSHHLHTHEYVPVPVPQPVVYMPRPTISANDVNYARLPNLVSSYNLPYLTAKEKEDLVASSYNKDKISNDAMLLRSVRVDNENLRIQNKIEKTNDLVDNIIGKVSVLQADLRKKNAEIRVKEDMLKLKEEYLRLKREPSLKSILKKSRSRSKSPLSHHHHHHHSRERSCSASRRSRTPAITSSSIGHHQSRERSCSADRYKRGKSPNHHHHYYDYKHEKPTTTTTSSSSSDDEFRRNRYWKSWQDVPPKVDSWNCDWKIY